MLDLATPTSLLDIRNVCRSFPKGSGEELLVLEKVDLTVRAEQKSLRLVVFDGENRFPP